MYSVINFKFLYFIFNIVGSHGSGDNHETQTPYVLWGSGVKQVKGKTLDPTTLNMSLEHRFDVQQVDLSPLMSTILSIPVPVNSVVCKFHLFLNVEFIDIYLFYLFKYFSLSS